MLLTKTSMVRCAGRCCLGTVYVEEWRARQVLQVGANAALSPCPWQGSSFIQEAPFLTDKQSLF